MSDLSSPYAGPSATDDDISYTASPGERAGQGASGRSKRGLLLGVIALFVVLGGLVYLLRPKPEIVDQVVEIPIVRVLPARETSVALTATSQGNVMPRQEIDLVPEVAGKIVAVSPAFISGGIFGRGEVLIQIDPRDYANEVTRAEAAVASARQQLTREQAEADQAARDWQDLGLGGEPSALALRKPQLAQARAELLAAQAQLESARLALERTRLRAPFDGQVREKRADVGQYVTPGAALGRIFSTDMAEIRLPLTDRQLASIALPGSGQLSDGPLVDLSEVGGPGRWTARIVRTEGVIDPASRVVFAVASVDDPYGLKSRREKPLRIGSFVQARIEGRVLESVIEIPRIALLEGKTVLVVDGSDHLEMRSVSVARTTPQLALISDGLKQGERVIVSPIEYPVDGMKVRIDDQNVAALPAAAGLTEGRTP